MPTGEGAFVSAETGAQSVPNNFYQRIFQNPFDPMLAALPK